MAEGATEAGTAAARALRSSGARQGAIMAVAMVAAGALDYAVNVIAGRWLEPVDFGVVVSVGALLQVLLALTIAIRTVVAFYVANLGAADAARVGGFVRRAWRAAWVFGLAATAVAAIVSPGVASALRLPDAWPLWAASAMVLGLVLRETVYGALQGIQAFTGLGFVQIAQAVLRLAFAVALIWAGGRATGVIAAQPLACFGAVAVGLWWLRPLLRGPAERCDLPVSWRYSMSTVAGLALFGLMTNMDALFVKRYYTPRVAGDYATVVTFEKISLFLPWAVGFVLFPKAAARRARGRDARGLVLVALAAALAPGLGVTAICALFPGWLVRSVFTRSYGDPGIVLGLASLAATMFAGIHIWLNYALSMSRARYVVVLVGVVLLQLAGMRLFGTASLAAMNVVMVCAGVLGNVAGLLVTWRSDVAPLPSPAVGAGGAAGAAPEA